MLPILGKTLFVIICNLYSILAVSAWLNCKTTVLPPLMLGLTLLTPDCVIVIELPPVLRLTHVDIVNELLSSTLQLIGIAVVINGENVIIK